MELLAWANHNQTSTWDKNSLGWRIYRFENGALSPASALHVPAWSGATRPTQFLDELQLADVDGDGLPDILIDRGRDSSADVAAVIHNRGNFSFGAEVPLAGAQLNGSFGYPVDADGDGRTEIVNLSWDDPEEWPQSFGLLPFTDPPPNYILPNGSPFSIDPSKYRVRTFVPGVNDVSIPYYSTRVLADVTGDGLSDLITVENAGVNVYASTANGFLPGRAWHGRLTDVIDGSGEIDRLAGGVIPADFNADGLTDLLALEAPDIRTQAWPGGFSGMKISSQPPTLLISDGSAFRAIDGFAAPQSGYRVRSWGPFRRGPAWGSATVGDIDGDGLPEIAQLEKRHQAETEPWLDRKYDLVVYSQREPSDPAVAPPSAETLTEVINGMGMVESVKYRPLTDPATYQPGTTCKLPQRCLKRGLSVVRQHRLSNAWAPSEGRDFYYTYEDARTDIRGRGFLGFKCVTATDIARAREVKSCYRQHETYDIPYKKACPGYAYPYAGLPSTVKVKQLLGGDRVRLSTTVNLYDDPPVSGPGHTFRTHLRRVEETVSEGVESQVTLPDGPAKQRYTRIDYTFDSMGNLREEYTRVFGRTSAVTPEFEERRFNQWVGADTNQWLTSRLESSEVQVTRRDEQMRKRVTAYEYTPNTQTVAKEIVRQADDNEDVVSTTVYTREPTGVVTAVTRTDASGDTRVDRIAYDGAKIFPRRLENALGHVTWVGQHPSTGDIVFTRDPNAVDQAWHYDWTSRVRRFAGADGAVLHRDYGRGDELADEIGAESRALPLAILTTGTTVPDSISYIDAWGRERLAVWRAADGTLSRETTIYDSLGRASFKSLPHSASGSPSGTFQFGHDFLDRPTWIRNPDGSEKTFAYPSFYEATATDEGTGSSGAARVRIVYDALGSTKQVFQDAGGADIRTDFTYDSLNNVRKVVRNANGSEPITTERAFDTLGRVTWHADPDRGTFRYRYSGHGHVRELTHEGVSTTLMKTDALGRNTTSSVILSAGGTEVTSFAYDEPGHGHLASQRGTVRIPT